jgi:hypothetical protein
MLTDRACLIRERDDCATGQRLAVRRVVGTESHAASEVGVARTHGEIGLGDVEIIHRGLSPDCWQGPDLVSPRPPQRTRQGEP